MKTENETPSLNLDAELKAALKLFYAKAAAAGLDEIFVQFSGSGDGGQMEGIEHTSPDGLPIPLEWGMEPDELAERVLEAHGGDWENNEGGFGTVQFRIKDNEVYVDFSYNVIRTEDDSKEAKL